MHGTFSTARLRRWAAVTASFATIVSGALVVGASPAAATTYTYAVTPVTVGNAPLLVAANPLTHRIYVANATDNTVSVIDGATDVVAATVQVGTTPYGLAINQATNKIYVISQVDSSVSVIDGDTNTVTTVAVGVNPTAVAINEVTNRIYVTTSVDSSVSVIDGDTNTVTTVAVGAYPLAVAVNQVTNKIYVTNAGDGTLSVIDGATNTATLVPGATGAYGMAVNETTNKIYSADYYNNTVSVIDGATNAVTTVPAVEPWAVAVNESTGKAYVTNMDNTVSVFGASDAVEATVAVGDIPVSVDVNPTTNTIYVVNNFSNSVSVIDGATNTVTTSIPVGAYPQAVSVSTDTGKVYVANNGTNTVSVLAQRVATSTTLTASPSPTAGEPVTLTATVNPVPTGGSISFANGVNAIPGCTAQPVDPTSGTATCVTTLPSAGDYTINAEYSGSAGYGASTATALTVTVAAVSSGTPTSNATPAVSRLAGSDRYTTAVAASKIGFVDGGADAVVLASGAAFPDALVGVPLADAKHAPLLLTSGTTLQPSTKAELTRVLPAGRIVYVIGGDAVIPATVASELTNLGYHVTRLAGADRYSTSLKVAAALGNPTTVLLASGRNYPDAVSAGPAASKTGGAVLLTAGSTVGSATRDYLAAHPGTVYAIGGPAAEARPTATPIVGADRYATSAAVAAKFFTAPTHVGVASGGDFPDALSGGALVGAANGPMLLADQGHTTAATAYVNDVRAGVGTYWVFGGTSAVPSQVADAITTPLSK